ncbi:MAG TPA: hypothetical protein VFA94_03790 [Acidimicrobiales bacterium]|nr:hypothetical protein [Acidimicrobiales bacterium]
MADVTKTLKDAGYVLVGLGVIGFQKAQVRRHELTQELEVRTKDLEAQLNELRGQVTKVTKDLEGKLEPVLQEIEGRIEELEGFLPEQMADLMKQARTTARELAREAQARFAGSVNGSAAA